MKLEAEYPEIALSPITFEMPVMWGDMDSAQHVNNLIYLKWTETSRILLFDKIGDISFDGDHGVILGWQDIKYIYPITFPDTALITAAVTEIKEDRFFIQSKVYSYKGKRIAAVTNQSIIPYNYLQFKKMPLTASWRERLTTLQVV